MDGALEVERELVDVTEQSDFGPSIFPFLTFEEDLTNMQKRFFNRTIALAVVCLILCTPAISLG